MHHSRSYHMLVALSCLVSGFRLISTSRLFHRAILHDLESTSATSFARFDSHYNLRGLSTPWTPRIQSESLSTDKLVNKLSAYLGGDVSLKFPQGLKIKNEKIAQLLAPRKLLPPVRPLALKRQREKIMAILQFLQNQEQEDKLIADLRELWDSTLSGIHEDLDSIEVSLKRKIKILVGELDPKTFLKDFGSEPYIAIENFFRNAERKLKHDPSHYFQDVILSTRQHDYMLDEFTRAQAKKAKNTLKALLQPESLIPEDGIIPQILRETDVKKSFFAHIMKGGIQKIVREIESQFLEDLRVKIIREDLHPGLEDLRRLLHSKDKADIEWRENLFAKARLDGLKPPAIFQKLHDLTDGKDRVELYGLLTQFLSDSKIDEHISNTWYSSPEQSREDFLKALGQEKEFTQRLMGTFIQKTFDRLEHSLYLKHRSYAPALSHIARQYGEMLRKEAQTIGFKEGTILSLDSFSQALREIDGKALHQAFVEAHVVPMSFSPSGPLKNFFDEIKAPEINHMDISLIQGPFLGNDFDIRLFQLNDHPLEMEDERLLGTKYENMPKEVRENLNNLAQDLEILHKKLELVKMAVERDRRIRILLTTISLKYKQEMRINLTKLSTRTSGRIRKLKQYWRVFIRASLNWTKIFKMKFRKDSIITRQ